MMKKVVCLIILVLTIVSCKKNKKEVQTTQTLVNEYSNPILQGFYPDPSICKVDSDYYMVNSTFAYFPGIPIFKSSDLVNWEQIGNVLNSFEQLDLDGLGISEGIFAPAINYNDGLYYVACTLVGKKGNFVVTAKNPEGPWSSPIWIPEVSGIDPSMFFDNNESAYIIYNSEAPDNNPEYEGHRTIKLIAFDVDKMKVVGQPHILINKGAKPKDKPIWIEGPHLYQQNGYYYLLAAEGGTSDEHSEVVFRSKTLFGPYENYENNPILTQRQLDPKREHPITSVGHADIIEDENGNWWGVFLGCRPYEDNHYNTGRETFMAPVIWKDNWPVFDLDGAIVKEHYPTPNNAVKKKRKYSGASTYREDFELDALGFEWLFLRTPKEKWHSLLNGELTINTRPETTSGTLNPSFIGYRQKHLFGNVTTNLSFNAVSENEKAGLIAFQNETHFYYLCKSLKDNKPVIQLLKSTKNGTEEIAFKSINKSEKISFKIEAKGKYYSFFYSINNKDWHAINENVDATFLSTKKAGGFVGTIYGMYTTSSGEKSTNKAIYHWFINKNIN